MNFLASLAARGAGLPLAGDGRTPQPHRVPAEIAPLTLAPAEEARDSGASESSLNLPDIETLAADVRDRVLADLQHLRPEPRHSVDVPGALEPQRAEQPPPLPPERESLPASEPQLKERVVEIIRSEGPAIFHTIESREVLPVDPVTTPAQYPAAAAILRPAPVDEVQSSLVPKKDSSADAPEREFMAAQVPAPNVVPSPSPEPPRVLQHAQPAAMKAAITKPAEPRPPVVAKAEPAPPAAAHETERQTVVRAISETHTREVRFDPEGINSPRVTDRVAERVPGASPNVPVMLARPAARESGRVEAQPRSTRDSSSPAVEVRIGTIEIKAPQPATTTLQIERPQEQPAAPPEDFGSYRGMRSYTGWWRGV